MLKPGRKVTVAVMEKGNQEFLETSISNPITGEFSDTDKLSFMIVKVIHEEFPMIKDNSLLFDLVLYSILEKLKTVQSVKNVLSYIKETNVKMVQDVSFKNGEVLIKCST